MNTPADDMSDDMSIADAFRRSMSLLTASVAVVTTKVEDRPWGMTITACCSVSTAPPTVLISLGEASATTHAVAEQGEYGLCLMGTGGVATAEFAAAPGRPKFLDEPHLAAPVAATPCVRGAIAHLDCLVTRTIPVADHVLFIGEVRGVSFPSSAPTLLYGAREFHRTVPALQLAGTETDLHALAYSMW